jgi:hypothetical protein
MAFLLNHMDLEYSFCKAIRKDLVKFPSSITIFLLVHPDSSLSEHLVTAASPQQYDMCFVSVDIVKMQEKEREKMYVAITFELGVHACLFVIYLMSMSVTQTTQHQTTV